MNAEQKRYGEVKDPSTYVPEEGRKEHIKDIFSKLLGELHGLHEDTSELKKKLEERRE